MNTCAHLFALDWIEYMPITQRDMATLRQHEHTHPFNGPLSGTIRVIRYQKGKANVDFTEARDSEWQWYQLGHMQVCTSLQADNHASTPTISFLQAGCSSCRSTNSVKALKTVQMPPWLPVKITSTMFSVIRPAITVGNVRPLICTQARDPERNP